MRNPVKGMNINIYIGIHITIYTYERSFLCMEENEGRQLSFSDIFTEEKEREERELKERWRQMEARYGTIFQDRKTTILSGERVYDLIEEMRIYGRK